MEADLQSLFGDKCVALPVQLFNFTEVHKGSENAFQISINPISIPKSEQNPQAFIEESFQTEVRF